MTFLICCVWRVYQSAVVVGRPNRSKPEWNVCHTDKTTVTLFLILQYLYIDTLCCFACVSFLNANRNIKIFIFHNLTRGFNWMKKVSFKGQLRKLCYAPQYINTIQLCYTYTIYRHSDVRIWYLLIQTFHEEWHTIVCCGGKNEKHTIVCFS